MNAVSITGRLTRDPETNTTTTGIHICTLRVAVDGMASGRETGYVTVKSFGKSGEAAARTLKKGWRVAVTGRLRYSEWEARDGAKRHEYEIVGHVEFLSAPRTDGAEADAEPEDQPERTPLAA
jgi:single-strand DNA-binding protein